MAAGPVNYSARRDADMKKSLLSCIGKKSRPITFSMAALAHAVPNCQGNVIFPLRRVTDFSLHYKITKKIVFKRKRAFFIFNSLMNALKMSRPARFCLLWLRQRSGSDGTCMTGYKEKQTMPHLRPINIRQRHGIALHPCGRAKSRFHRSPTAV